ncbi:hypothetical protein [Paenibacillus thailandensis]|uniref:Uncharacterized protein n=1 Tax=Paenibacillus thailandensis TaxID=393250 RepID=A0ABW5R3J5_9BACL
MMIRIPHYAFTLEGDKKLSPDEAITFSFLFKYHNVDDEFITSIDLLSKVLKFKKGNDSENKSHVRDILVSLQCKGYINCDIDEFTEYTKIVIGKIINLDKGYSGIDNSVLDNLLREDLNKAKLKFYIYADINRFSDGSKLSFEVISSKCEYFNSIKHYATRTIQDIINEMDGKLIYRFSGQRIDGSPEQEVNTYFSDKNMSEEKKRIHIQHVNEKKVKQSRIRKDTEIIQNKYYGDDITVKDLKIALKESNWGKRDSFGIYEEITYHDYFVFRLAKDENVAITFVKKVELIIERLNDNPDCEYDFDEWEKEYKTDIRLTEEESVNENSSNKQEGEEINWHNADDDEPVYTAPEPDYSDIYDVFEEEDEYMKLYMKTQQKKREKEMGVAF